MSVSSFKSPASLDNNVDAIDLGTGNVTVGVGSLNKTLNSAFEEVLNLDSFISEEKKEITYEGLKKKIDTTHLPFYDDKHRYRFQGFTVTEDNIYVTAHGKKGDPSVILVYDKDGNYRGILKLPKGGGRDSHVGGISYDSLHNVLYLTGTDGKVLVINNEYLENIYKDNDTRNDKPFNIDLDDDEDFDINSFLVDGASIDLKRDLEKYLKDHNIDDYDSNIKDDWFHEMLESSNIIKDKSSSGAASVYYDEINHKLYVPTFSRDSKIFVYDVSFDEEGNPIYTFKDIYGMDSSSDFKIDDVDLPYGLQGVATYTYPNGDTYLLMVSSYGTVDSSIAKYRIKEDGSLEFAGQHIFYGKKGLENVVVDSKTGDVYCNFENYAGGSDNDGSEFESINVDNINGSNKDYRYIENMRKMYGASSNYER